jgi:zinc and cadmium transporter
LATTLAVVLHEIPQEVGDFAVLLHAGYTKQRAIFLNFLTALSAFFGAALFFVIGEYAIPLTAYFVPLTAGGFIYIAVADLIPELQKTKWFRDSLYQLAAVICGVVAMAALTLFE